MKRKNIVRVLLLAAVLALLAVIWVFSDQPGEVSEGLTVATAMPLAEMAAAAQSEGDAAVLATWYHIFGTIFRKTAHLLEYTLLGLLLGLLARSFSVKAIWIPWAAGTILAAMDEVHQYFVPGRTGLVTDVLLDSAGVLLGICALYIIHKIRRKNHVHDQ